MKLNREQIIKALECWASGNPCEGSCCPLFEISPDTCDRWIGRNALALIKELTEDVERVSKQCGEIIVECDERDAERLKQVAELTGENEEKDETIAGLIGTIKDAYGFAVREMKARLDKNLIAIKDHTGKIGLVVLDRDIDQIAEEMLEKNTSTINANTCICCGAIIPEGTLTCPKCNIDNDLNM